MDSDAVVGLLAEEDRLQTFAAIVLGAATLEAVVDATGLDQRRATMALERLAGGGLIVQTKPGGGLEVATGLIKDVAVEAAKRKAAAEPPDDFGPLPADAVAVLRNYVRGGRLTSIPTNRNKRRVVLDWLATRFEIGKTYPERDVNFMLGMVHADVAALRRYLVDEEFLERRDGFYWRAGGTVEVD